MFFFLTLVNNKLQCENIYVIITSKLTKGTWTPWGQIYNKMRCLQNQMYWSACTSLFIYLLLHQTTLHVLVEFPGDRCYGPVTVTTMQCDEYVGTASTRFSSFGWQMAFRLFLSFRFIRGPSLVTGACWCCRCWCCSRYNHNLHVVTNIQMGVLA